MNDRWVRRNILCLVLLVSGLWGCAPGQPIRIGVSAELSGKQSEASLNMRNGVRLAAEEINQAGGIGGRMIEVLVEDDLGEPEGAIRADSKLIQAGVAAIIGHLTSNQTMAGYSVTEPNNMVLFSPTAATSLLSAKRDHFFRLFPTNDDLGKQLARYVVAQRKIQRVGIIFDQDNDSYSVPFADAFEATLAASGGTASIVLPFHGSDSPKFAPMVKQLHDSGAEGVFIIAASFNAALIAQEIHLANWNVPLFAAPWAQGDELIQKGGKAVEGMELLLPYNLEDDSPALTQFKSSYRDHFSANPTFAAMFGYESMRFLANALKRTGGNAAGLSQALESLGSVEGLSGPLRLNEYGDVTRPLYIVAIQEKQFVTKIKLVNENS